MPDGVSVFDDILSFPDIFDGHFMTCRDAFRDPYFLSSAKDFFAFLDVFQGNGYVVGGMYKDVFQHGFPVVNP